MRNTKLTPHEERVVAVRAGCDPRIVRKYLAGGVLRSTTAARIAEALRELGELERDRHVGATGALMGEGFAAFAGSRVGD
jgi:hypothetical protein